MCLYKPHKYVRLRRHYTYLFDPFVSAELQMGRTTKVASGEAGLTPAKAPVKGQRPCHQPTPEACALTNGRCTAMDNGRRRRSGGSTDVATTAKSDRKTPEP